MQEQHFAHAFLDGWMNQQEYSYYSIESSKMVEEEKVDSNHE
jgi:hypothetical protein